MLDPEVVEDELDWSESPIAVVDCDVNTSITKPDDIATLVAREVGYESSVLVNLPSLCSSEVVEDQVDRPKSTSVVVQRRPASGTSATNDLSSSFPSQSGHEAGVKANLLSSSADADVVDDGLRWRKSLIAVVATDKDVAFPETNDIEKPVSCDVSKETKVAVEAPTTSAVVEVVQSESARAEVSVAIVSGDKDSRFPKTDDISSANVPDVDHIAYVLFDIAVVSGNPHTTIAKPNDVASLLPHNICHKTRVIGV